MVKLTVSDMIRIGNKAVPARVHKDWQDRVKRLLKAELSRTGVNYRELAERLRAIGVDENERNIANKISRGGFTAAFFFQCMAVIGCRTIHLDTDR
jgi:hypothetical protein